MTASAPAVTRKPAQPERNGSTGNPIPQPAPDLSAILAIHRGGDGFISFHSTDGGHYRGLFSIRASELPELLPPLRQHLVRDSHFSINAFYRAGRGRSDVAPDLPTPYRNESGLRYLNAAFADLDSHKIGMSYGQTVGLVIDAADAGLIPPPSMVADSGRGAWVFWLLRDRLHPDRPETAHAAPFDLYCRVQRAIRERLATLSSDASDAVRAARFPGSINSKSGRIVAYTILAGEDGRGFVYTLTDLTDLFGLPRRVYHPKVRHAVDPALSEKRRRAWQACQAKRLRQFERLRSLRGGFSDGCRNRAAMLLVHFLAKNRLNLLEIQAELDKLADECSPPLTKLERRDAVKSGLKLRTGSQQISNARISQWLDITPGESEQLEGWPPAPRFGTALSMKPATRQELMDNRRRAIQTAVGSLGSVPSTRQMVGMLVDRFGIEASWVTVASDYRALGLSIPPDRSPDEPLFRPGV